jgi:excisionase family DNA binding protein
MLITKDGISFEEIVHYETRKIMLQAIHFDVKKAAEMLSVSNSTIYEAIRSKKIKALRVGDRKGISISLEALLDYVEKNSNHTGGDSDIDAINER